jgi:hypothetical protein
MRRTTNHRQTVVAACVCAIFALAAPRAAEAHHGWAEFDSTAEITLEGTVSQFHFTNPHCVVEFRAVDKKGQMRLWQGEFANPGQLARAGWNAASLQPGDKITVTGNPAKNGSPAVHVMKIAVNGKALIAPQSN